MPSLPSGHTEDHEPAGVGHRSGGEAAMAEPGEPGTGNAVGRMHPAPSLKEAPPINFPRSRPYDLQAMVSKAQSPGPGSGSTGFETNDLEHFAAHDPAGPGPRLPRPFRKNTNDSTTTATTYTTSTSLLSADVATTSPSHVTSPPTGDSQPSFSIQDGPDGPDERHTPKTTRRRTGPLNQEQRIKAAIIRKIGACQDCKRRRVSCDPTHHGETWESAVAKYGSDIPSIAQELLQVVSSRDSVCSSRPTTANRKRDSQTRDLVSPPASAGPCHHSQGIDLESSMEYTGHRQFSEDLSLESSPTSQKSPSDQPPQKKRKPLPGAPGDRPLQSTAQAALSVPAIHPGRYTTVRTLHLQWANEYRQDFLQAGMDLEKIFREDYGFSYQSDVIPLSSSHKHLSDVVRRFTEHEDDRDVLKIIYYGGDSYLDGDRNMMLAGPTVTNPICDIRWDGIQIALQETISDVLLIMDCPYWTPNTFKRCGVLEILAASNFADFAGSTIPAGSFTTVLSKRLRDRAAQTYEGPPYVTDIHAHLAAEYRHVIPETRYNEERIMNFPTPVHMLISGKNTPRSSIQLAPRSHSNPRSRSGPRSDRALAPPEDIRLRFFGEDDRDRAALDEWLRIKPHNVQVRTEEHAVVAAGSSAGLLERRGAASGFLTGDH